MKTSWWQAKDSIAHDDNTHTLEASISTERTVGGTIGFFSDGSMWKSYSGSPIRYERIEAPTVGRAWKAPVYRCSDGTEFIDFNSKIEIEWNEEI